MASKLRRRILTPPISETKLSVRGFHEKSPESRDLLEKVGESFLLGYAYAAEAGHPTEAEVPLEEMPTRFRGFAYEGAGMALGVRDGLPFGGTHHVSDFLTGQQAAKHLYMVYVGVGWALARVPRFRWQAATKGITDELPSWLVLDGYGFHQAYFKTEKYVHNQFQEPNFPWPANDPTGYADHAIDQGIGRATWFVCGSDPERVAATFAKFPEHRRADLYAGSGLAASYAGGGDEAELVRFHELAGEYRPQLAQGSAFAASARVGTGLVIPHTVLATGVFCGMTPEEADELCNATRPDDSAGEGDVPAFEIWRRRIAEGIVSKAS
ncbi:MAG TPA: DUF1702 family protein [Pseudonocardiaceae bacterium]|jgi:hypothetical protein|nr:DUF1702 family protein [Pseudonocardiaceae bacterium]